MSSIGRPSSPFEAADATDGSSVGDLLRSAGPLPVSKAVTIIRDCALVLQAAWDTSQSAHGSIGIEGIRLQSDGTVKLAGLALARPEESPRAGDIQALGDALYQMLTNAPRLRPEERMPDLAVQRPDLGPFVGEVIEKMRAQAAWNYASYGELIADLEAVLDRRQPAHTQVKLTLGTASAPTAAASAKLTTPAHVRPRRRAAFDWKTLLIRLTGLAILTATAWLTWQFFNRQGLMPLPPAPATPAPPIALVPAEPQIPPSATPAVGNIADPVERGRAMATQLGVARLQGGFGGLLGVLNDGQIRWSYAFRSEKEMADFSEGMRRLQDGALLLPRGQTAFKCPLLGDVTMAIEGRVIEAEPELPLLALGVIWHQSGGGERAFGFTRTVAELSEIVAGKRVILATAPFEWKPGVPLGYLVTQRGQACVVKVRNGPLLMGRFSQPAEGALRLVSDGCSSAYSVLEITATALATKLLPAAP